MTEKEMVLAWAKALGITTVWYYYIPERDETVLEGFVNDGIVCTTIDYWRGGLELDKEYTIADLFGEEKE